MATITLNPTVSGAPTSNGASDNWAAHHNLATATAISLTGGDSVNTALIEASTTTNEFTGIARGAFIFNLATLGVGATINSATFKFWVTGKTDQLGGSGAIALCNFTPASYSTIATTDFTDGVEMGTTIQATNLTIAGLTTGALNTWTLNAAGLANLTTQSGLSIGFALRVERDRANTAPTWGSGELSRIYGSIGSNGTYQPELYIDYTPLPSSSMFLMF